MDNSASAQLLGLMENWTEEQPELPLIPIHTAGVTTPHVASISVPIIGQGEGAQHLRPAGPMAVERGQELALTCLRAGLDLCRSLGGHADDIYRVPIALALQQGAQRSRL